jgi:hypothetical protein
MTRARLAVLAALSVAAGTLLAEDPLPAGEPPGPTLSEATLGLVAVEGCRDATVFLNEYKAFYDLQIAVPLDLRADGTTDPVEGGRFTAWLLAKDGKALLMRERPDKGPLVETSTGRSVSAHAMFEFAHDVPLDQVVAAVVQVDEDLTVLAVTRKR